MDGQDVPTAEYISSQGLYNVTDATLDYDGIQEMLPRSTIPWISLVLFLTLLLVKAWISMGVHCFATNIEEIWSVGPIIRRLSTTQKRTIYYQLHELHEFILIVKKQIVSIFHALGALPALGISMISHHGSSGDTCGLSRKSQSRLISGLFVVILESTMTPFAKFRINTKIKEQNNSKSKLTS